MAARKSAKTDRECLRDLHDSTILIVQYIDPADHELMRRMPASDASIRKPYMEDRIGEARRDMERARAQNAKGR